MSICKNHVTPGLPWRIGHLLLWQVDRLRIVKGTKDCLYVSLSSQLLQNGRVRWRRRRLTYSCANIALMFVTLGVFAGNLTSSKLRAECPYSWHWWHYPGTPLFCDVFMLVRPSIDFKLKRSARVLTRKVFWNRVRYTSWNGSYLPLNSLNKLSVVVSLGMP